MLAFLIFFKSSFLDLSRIILAEEIHLCFLKKSYPDLNMIYVLMHHRKFIEYFEEQSFSLSFFPYYLGSKLHVAISLVAFAMSAACEMRAFYYLIVLIKMCLIGTLLEEFRCSIGTRPSLSI